MGERPILFSSPMIKALLAGRKSQTRRVLKPQPPFSGGIASGVSGTGGVSIAIYPEYLGGPGGHFTKTPFGVGDRLWVREAWNIAFEAELAPGEKIERSAEDCSKANKGFACPCGDGIVYRATGAQSHPVHGKALWRSPIYMPRWASRITLVVTDVRVERLQDISEADAAAEGVRQTEQDGAWNAIPGYAPTAGMTPIGGFYCLWNHINGPRSWEANPWVAAISFRTILANIDSEEPRDA